MSHYGQFVKITNVNLTEHIKGPETRTSQTPFSPIPSFPPALGLLSLPISAPGMTAFCHPNRKPQRYLETPPKPGPARCLAAGSHSHPVPGPAALRSALSRREALSEALPGRSVRGTCRARVRSLCFTSCLHAGEMTASPRASHEVQRTPRTLTWGTCLAHGSPQNTPAPFTMARAALVSLLWCLLTAT